MDDRRPRPRGRVLQDRLQHQLAGLGRPDPRRSTTAAYPNFESDAGINSFRNAYAPFQERETDILLLRGKYVLNVGNGVDVFGKVKWIDETDERMTESRFLPFRPGDCPGGGVACANSANSYFGSFSTSAIYFNPPVITVNGVTGYQWKPFDSLSDDDREMDYQLIQLGAGYQSPATSTPR